MKLNVKRFVKYIKPIYRMYHAVGNVMMKFMGYFIPVDNKKILFISYGGKKFDDSPRVIYEAMLVDDRFKEYEKIWAFEQPQLFETIEHKIKVDSIKYFITALSSRIWITNSSVERGLNFKQKTTLYFNSWHGVPLKKMGDDVSSKNQSFKLIGKSNIDIMLAQSEYDKSIYVNAFNIDEENIFMTGLPRNDSLLTYNAEQRNYIREGLGIPKEKKAILYMPTFREFSKTSSQECMLDIPIDFDKWKTELGKDYVFLFRAHYEVSKTMAIEENSFIRNVTDYPVLEELLIASDLLISDYSSVYFDYSILDKPMLQFTYDFEEYSKERGLYFNVRDEINGADNEIDLIEYIQNFDYQKHMLKQELFKKKYVHSMGNSTKTSLDLIYSHIRD